MGNYQYQSRVTKLRERGVDVYEFGNRVLREGCFGEDVLQLQNWLAEESYYNPLDGGFTGYFGGVTRESLQAWQIDNGLEGTGNFDAASRWVYLHSLEARSVQPAQNATSEFIRSASLAIPSSFPSLTTLPTFTVPSGTPVFMAAAVVAGLALASAASSLLRRKKTPARGKLCNQAPVTMGSNTPGYYADEAAHDYDHAEPAAMEYDTPRDTPSRPSRLRRLTDEELQRYIAPFKGAKNGPRRPAPQRPAPRSLVLSTEEGVADDAVSSRHGTYYGGRKVLEHVKSYLEEEGSLPSPGGAVSQRMQSLGYDMRAGRKASPTKDSPPSSPKREKPASAPVQKVERPRNAGMSVTSNPALSNGSSSYSSFENNTFSDEREEPEEEVEYRPVAPPQAPLIRMDIQEAPSKAAAAAPPRPVPVQKPSRMTGPISLQNGNGSQSNAAAAPRKPTAAPVPVVKSQRYKEERAEHAMDPDEPNFDPNATVVLDRPVKLHKPARLASNSSDYSLSDD